MTNASSDPGGSLNKSSSLLLDDIIKSICPNWGLEVITDYCCAGVDFSLPGNGGPECLKSSSLTRRIYETGAGLAASAIAIVISLMLLSKAK